MAASPASEGTRETMLSRVRRGIAHRYTHEEPRRWRRSGWSIMFLGILTVAIDLWGFVRGGGPAALVPHLLLMLSMGLMIGGGITSILTARYLDLVIDLREEASTHRLQSSESTAKDS
jgi:hypothetical protein